MKIWILATEYPGSRTGGGIARYVENLANSFQGKDVELTVITRGTKNYHHQISQGYSIVEFTSNHDKGTLNLVGSPTQCASFPYNIMAYWPALSYQMADLVESLIQKIGAPDVIECQDYTALSYFLLQRKLTGNPALQNIPILVHCHGPAFLVDKIDRRPSILPDYWVGEMEKFCIAAADARLCPSNAMAKKLTEYVSYQGETKVIPLPGPSTMFFAPTLPPPSPSEKPTVLYFGRLQILKGILPALEAIESLWNAGRDFRVVLLGGDTAYMPRETTVGTLIRSRYAHRLQEGSLIMHDSCPAKEVAEYITAAHVVIVPSLFENFPNTCMEAMSMGRVVLASKSGGQAEMIGEDGRSGFLFDWEVPGDFTTQLDRLLKISQEERAQIGMRARNRITELCSVEKISTQRLQHFEEIIKQYKKPSLFPVSWFGYKLPASIRNANSPCQGNAEAPRLSVVIPFFNLGKYVGDTLKSVLASTCLPEEILIVNDGSTEEASLTILRELESQHPTLRVIHQPNQGVSSARNRGANEARGNYIAFIDADDEVQPEFFSKALRVLDAYANVGFVYSWNQCFESSHDMFPTWNVHFPYLLGSNTVAANCVIRTEAFLEVGGNNVAFEYYLEDYECWINLTKHGWVGVALPECLVRYRVRSGSRSRSATNAGFRYQYDLIVRTHPELYQRWGGELAQLQASNGSALYWDQPAKPRQNFQSESPIAVCERMIRRFQEIAFVRFLLGQPTVVRILKSILRRMSAMC